MPQQLELYPESMPYVEIRNGMVVNAAKTRRGDVEISRDSGEYHQVLTVIPKSERAKLAAFLVSND